MSDIPPTQEQATPTVDEEGPEGERERRHHSWARFESAAARHPLLRTALGIHLAYRDAGGSLVASGLAYAALFALVPSLALVAAGLVLLVDDSTLRDEALDLVLGAFPVLESLAAPAIDGVIRSAAFGSIVALVGFGWAASGLYLNLTRAMERFFPGERVNGAIARVFGIILVVLVIFGVLAAVVVAGALSFIARVLAIDVEWLLAVTNAVTTLALASGITYGIYRVLPSRPPSAAGARLPALLVGLTIGLLTLFYGLLSPWLVSSFQVFGIMAAVFVALVWLRLIFMALTYGAAMARFRDELADG